MKRLKFEAWCQVKGTAEEKALLEEYMAAKKITKWLLLRLSRRKLMV